MAAWLLALALLGGADGKHWSEKHRVGMFVRPTWEILERDRGDVVFRIRGPKLGPGYPMVVLHALGEARGRTLGKIAKKVRAKLAARPDWKVRTEKRRRVGSFPAVRFHVDFREGEALGRARATVALLGGRYFLLEMSAPASYFPGAAYGLMEGSLSVAWTEHDHPAGRLVLEVPEGWTATSHAAEGVLVVRSPDLGPGHAVLALARDRPAPPFEGDGGKLRFLGAERSCRTAEEDGVLRLSVRADPWVAVVSLPVEVREDLLPTIHEILSRCSLAPREPS